MWLLLTDAANFLQGHTKLFSLLGGESTQQLISPDTSFILTKYVFISLLIKYLVSVNNYNNNNTQIKKYSSMTSPSLKMLIFRSTLHSFVVDFREISGLEPKPFYPLVCDETFGFILLNYSESIHRKFFEVKTTDKC